MAVQDAMLPNAESNTRATGTDPISEFKQVSWHGLK